MRRLSPRSAQSGGQQRDRIGGVVFLYAVGEIPARDR
jgi:hypothetical protein